MSAPLWWSREIEPGAVGRDVDVVQKLLMCFPSGCMDLSTTAAVRGFQVALGLPATGWVDEATAVALGPLGSEGALPSWWKGEPLIPSDQGYEEITGGEQALRRFQGNHGLPATGVVDESTARLLGGLVDATGSFDD